MTREQELARLLEAKRAKERQAELDILNAEKARKSLAHFAKMVWPIIEPSTPLQWSWIHDCICDHLEECWMGGIQNIAFCVPPGSLKSYLVCQVFPAWVLLHDPGSRFICCANKEDLALWSSMQCRDIIRSDWYAAHFPQVEIAPDQDMKTWFGTTRRGFRQVATVGGKILGKRADVLIIDDPNDADEIHSKQKRDAVTSWYDTTAWNRINDPNKSRRIAVAQRTGREDLIGHLMERHGYYGVVVPMEYDPRRTMQVSPIGWKDPRTEPGELMHPERFGPERVAEAKNASQFMYQALYNQDPTDVENAHFKPDYFKHRWRWAMDSRITGRIVLERGEDDRYEFDSAAALCVASFDAAASAKTSADNSALSVFLVSPRGDLIWLDCLCRQLDIPDQPKLLAEARAKWPFSTIAIEAAGSNRAAFQFAQRMMLPAVPYNPGNRDKLVRAQSAITLASQGMIWLPDRGMMPSFDVDACLEELVRFTGQSNNGRDDRVDTVSMVSELLPSMAAYRMGKEGLPKVVDVLAGSRMPTPSSGPRFGVTPPGTPTRRATAPSVMFPSHHRR